MIIHEHRKVILFPKEIQVTESLLTVLPGLCWVLNPESQKGKRISQINSKVRI